MGLVKLKEGNAFPHMLTLPRALRRVWPSEAEAVLDTSGGKRFLLARAKLVLSWDRGGEPCMWSNGIYTIKTRIPFLATTPRDGHRQRTI